MTSKNIFHPTLSRLTLEFLKQKNYTEENPLVLDTPYEVKTCIETDTFIDFVYTAIVKLYHQQDSIIGEDEEGKTQIFEDKYEEYPNGHYLIETNDFHCLRTDESLKEEYHNFCKNRLLEIVKKHGEKVFQEEENEYYTVVNIPEKLIVDNVEFHTCFFREKTPEKIEIGIDVDDGYLFVIEPEPWQTLYILEYLYINNISL